MKKYFYIITFDGQIFEVCHTNEKFNNALNAWKNGSLLIMEELGGGIHGSSISKVMNEDLYENYISTVKPKLYIKNGAWRDGKEHQVIRYEKWRQLEIEKIEKLEAPNTEPKEIPNGQIWSHRENKMLSAKEVFGKYRPQFMREIDQKNLTK